MGSVSNGFILVLEDTFCDPSGTVNERSADMKTSLTIATIALGLIKIGDRLASPGGELSRPSLWEPILLLLFLVMIGSVLQLL
jgi:hypothetical protein